MKKNLVRSLILTWMFFQAAVPAFNKFQGIKFRYHFAKFSWAMYSWPRTAYEAEVFELAPDGTERPVKNLQRYIRNKGDLMNGAMYFYPEEIQGWYKKLVGTIVRDERISCGVRIRWTRIFREDIAPVWEYRLP